MQIIYENSNTLLDLVDKIESFTVIKNNNKITISKTDSKFKSMQNNTEKLFSNRLVPALGVSIHNLTVEEIKTGNWIEIHFNKTQTKNDLSFNSLLIKLEETGGINLIRKFNNLYDGRCLYLQFDEIINLNYLIK